LRDLDGAESDVPAELDDQVVAVTASRPAEFVVAEPYFIQVLFLLLVASKRMVVS